MKSRLGPVFAFALASSVGGGILAGAIVTLFAFIAVLVALAAGIYAGDLKTPLAGIADSVELFLEALGISLLYGSASGAWCGLVVGFTRSNAGEAWALISLFGLLFYFGPFVGGRDFFNAPLLFCCIGALGVIYPVALADSARKPKEFEPEFHRELRGWFKRNWRDNSALQSPISIVFGFALPFLLFVGLETYFVLPEFQKHPIYAARLGKWVTWKQSRRLVSQQNAHRFSPRSSCQSNLKQIGLGLAMYSQDYDEFLPPAPNSPESGAAWVLQPYLKSTQIFQCPSEFLPYTDSNPNSGDYTDYWFNSQLSGISFSKVQSPTQIVAWGDGNTGSGEGNAAYAISAIPSKFAPASRHLGGANYAFADGHVKWLKAGIVSNAPSQTGATMAVSTWP